MPLLADLSDKNATIKQAVEELNSRSIPLLAIYPSDPSKQVMVLRDLVTQSVRMVAASDRFNSRYSEAESELANLANLYVALSQLHAARSVRHS